MCSASWKKWAQLGYRKKWLWSGRDYPARNVNIRSSSGESFAIVSIEKGGALLGTVDVSSAYETIHPGAVYLHGGESYIVSRLDIESKSAYVERTQVNYYTTPGSRSTVGVTQEVESRDLCLEDTRNKPDSNLLWRCRGRKHGHTLLEEAALQRNNNRQDPARPAGCHAGYRGRLVALCPSTSQTR